ncbi:MAG: VanZ family protein [Myxococcota bacterium]|jgi:VanZ family protein
MPESLPDSVMNRIRRLPDQVWIGMLLLWTAALLQGTLSPITALTDPPFAQADKVLHFAGWFGLAWLASALADSVAARLVVWFACTVFGFLVEIGQIPIPLRSFEELDLLADTAGAAMGVVLALDRPDPK